MRIIDAATFYISAADGCKFELCWSSLNVLEGKLKIKVL